MSESGTRDRPVRILVVDDHELFRAGLRSRLESEGDIAPVGEAGTAEQAVLKARALQPDLVLRATRETLGSRSTIEVP